MRRTLCRLLAAAFVCLLGAAPALAADTTSAAQTAFERIKSLEGKWVGTFGNDPFTTVFEVTSGGKSVIEREFPGTDHEMITVFFIDRGNLVGQHYCVLGNQPRYKFVDTGDPNVIRLDFDGGTNLDPQVDAHAHAGVMRFLPDGTLESDWEFWQGGKVEHQEPSVLKRAP